METASERSGLSGGTFFSSFPEEDGPGEYARVEAGSNNGQDRKRNRAASDATGKTGKSNRKGEHGEAEAIRDTHASNAEERKEKHRHDQSPDRVQFCHDFQNSECSRKTCKFIHASSKVEKHYKETGRLDLSIENDPDTSKATRKRTESQEGEDNAEQKKATEPSDDVRFCHDYQNTQCDRDPCNFIHTSSEIEKRYKRTGFLPQKVEKQVIEKKIIRELSAAQNRAKREEKKKLKGNKQTKPGDGERRARPSDGKGDNGRGGESKAN
jgi:hypothetical protein